MTDQRKLYGRIEIRATLEVITGLHIGAAESVMHVGGIDAQIVRDPVSQEPYIPGTSLRGKLRSLLERRSYGIRIGTTTLTYNRNVDNRGNKRHECDDRDAALACPVCRLFGSTAGGSNGKNHPSRLFVRDSFLQPASARLLKQLPTPSFMTEWKFENALDRITAAANPRQLERVPRGALFDVELTYAVETNDRTVLTQDLARVFEACALLESDALGGHGSRGYGKIVFRDVTLSERRFRGEGGPSVAVASIEQPSDPIRAVVADLSLD